MVAAITLNRVESERYPDTVCEVISQQDQFSWTRSGFPFPKDVEAWKKSVEIAGLALTSRNDLYRWNGAMHYSANQPHWIESMSKVGTVGKHHVWSE